MLTLQRLLSSSFGSGSLVFNLASALKHLVSPQLDGFLVASKVGAWIVTISVNNIAHSSESIRWAESGSPSGVRLRVWFSVCRTSVL